MCAAAARVACSAHFGPKLLWGCGILPVLAGSVFLGALGWLLECCLRLALAPGLHVGEASVFNIEQQLAIQPPIAIAVLPPSRRFVTDFTHPASKPHVGGVRGACQLHLSTSCIKDSKLTTS